MVSKKWPILIIGLVYLIIGAARLQAEVVPEPGPGPAPKVYAGEPKVEKLLSVDYGRLVVDDARRIATAPSRMDSDEWIFTGLGVSAIAATMAFADKPMQKDLQKHRNDSSDNFARYAERFGAEYSFIALGAFELEGIACDDDRSKAVAQDGLAASIIASGVITPSLKLIIGRSRPDKDKGARYFRPFSGNDSFPSWHATQAFAVASVIADHYDSWFIKAGSYGIAAMVGYARMELNAHWTSDVLAGAFIGTAVGKTVTKFNKGKRYQLSAVSDGEIVGLKASHAF